MKKYTYIFFNWIRCQKLFKIWMINADTSAYYIALSQSECSISLMSALIEQVKGLTKL